MKHYINVSFLFIAMCSSIMAIEVSMYLTSDIPGNNGVALNGILPKEAKVGDTINGDVFSGIKSRFTGVASSVEIVEGNAGSQLIRVVISPKDSAIFADLVKRTAGLAKMCGLYLLINGRYMGYSAMHNDEGAKFSRMIFSVAGSEALLRDVIK